MGPEETVVLLEENQLTVSLQRRQSGRPLLPPSGGEVSTWEEEPFKLSKLIFKRVLKKKKIHIQPTKAQYTEQQAMRSKKIQKIK